MGSCISLHKLMDAEAEFHIGKVEDGPISRLPDNVLYLVFIDVASAEPIYDIHGFASSVSKTPSYYDCLGWTRLSAVCRRWRAVLLGAASLWAEGVFYFPSDMAVLALARSATAPLNVVIPPCEDKSSELARKTLNRKKWGLPHTHRERLLNLANTHSHRIRKVAAEDLSSQHYHMIFKNGPFDSLTTLVLVYAYNESSPSAPSREELDDLRIDAPHVREATFSPTLPIAYDGRPGLHIFLPALRKLKVVANLLQPTTVPTSVEQLLWIASLICDAPNLEHLEMKLSIADLIVDWEQLFSGKHSHVPALRALIVDATADIHLDQLFDIFTPNLPSKIMIRLFLMESETLGTYGTVMGRAMRQHSLDSVYLSQKASQGTIEAVPGILLTSISVLLAAFPSAELFDLKSALNAYLSRHSSQAAQAMLLVSSPSFSPEPNVAPPDNSGHILEMVAPILMHNEVKTLILDEISTAQWENTMREVMPMILTSVTTVYCINARRGVLGKSQPCTVALRLLYGVNKAKALDESPVRISNSNSADPSETRALSRSCQGKILPSLQKIVVTMNVTLAAEDGNALRSTADVRVWWGELIRALTHRQGVGLRVRVLLIVGGWTSEKLRKRMAKMDMKMLARAGVLVDEVVDERLVFPRLG